MIGPLIKYKSTARILLFPGDYLSVISCYYQVLVEVPRSTAVRD